VRTLFYQAHSGNSPIEKFIESLPKADQERFAEVYEGILKHGIDCPRAVFKPIKGKLWEVKFKAEVGSIGFCMPLLTKTLWLGFMLFKRKHKRLLNQI
jgi:hypothetical protein